MPKPRIRVTGIILLAALSIAPAAPISASDFDIIINEIHYNPFSGDDRDEYIELYNRGGTAVDLSGWRFLEGIGIAFGGGVAIEPKEFLLVSPDAAHAAARYGMRAVGNYIGRLDNAGEVIALANGQGELISRVHYGDGGVWASSPDGLGPSLELIDPHARVDIPWNWAPSRYLGGTPGRLNSTAQPPGAGEIPLIADGEVWRYLKGRTAFPAGWQQSDFDDSGWDAGPSGIGYGDGDHRTELTDMPNGYLSFLARRAFTLTQSQIDGIGELSLAVTYDDGFVANLNGVEVARVNLGALGTPVPFDRTADAAIEPAETETFSLPAALLRPGRNVLAVQLHNGAIDSSDANFIPRLTGRPPAPLARALAEGPIAINEVKPVEGMAAGFIELFNRSAAAVPVGRWVIADSAGRRFAIPAGASIPAGGRMVFSSDQLGFPTALAGATYALLEADGITFADGLNPSPGRTGLIGASFGRFPDGDDDGFVMAAPTSGAANQVAPPPPVIINEINFHPPFVPPGGACLEDCSDLDQWIELHNAGGTAVDLIGWSFTKAVEFRFTASTPIPPGGYLVVAASRSRFLDTHPGFDPARVAGDWLGPNSTRVLAHGSDTINLRDPDGNLADHVRYGDGRPLNDLEPEDGIDDGTFHGSEWPRGAEGSGRTIELIHPLLDNRLGAAWGLGPAGGTPGAANAALDPARAAVGDVVHSPGVPRSNQAVTVRCRISAASAILQARVLWRRDGGGPSGAADLRDDGASGDGAAGDGLFAAAIPAQPNGTVIAFQIEATLAGAIRTLVPRPPPAAPYPGFAGPFYLYQVIDANPPSNPSPSYYIVMTAADRQQLESRPVESDVLLYATFIARPVRAEEEVRHLCGIRYRGAGTRDATPRSYRIDFPSDRPFQGIEHLNLLSQDIDNEIIATDLFLRAGLPAALEWTVNFTFQGTSNPRYVRKEHLDADFLERYFGGRSGDGNLYRAFNPDDNATFPFQGDLSYLGPDPESYRPYYLKRSNQEADDYSDVIELCRTFDPAETPDAAFADAIELLIDPWQWARFFAIQACLSNDDGGIHNNSGEDYFLYRVPADSNRSDAGKWILIPWDLEESFDDSAERLFRPDIAAVRRFLTHPRFAPLYYCNLLNLRSGVFSRAETRQRYRLIDFLFGFSTIDGLESYITARIGFIDENVPITVTAGASAIPGDLFVRRGDSWKYFKGTTEPSGGTLAWAQPGFDDSTWSEGPSGFGYGDGDDATVLSDMEGPPGGYSTLYARRRFDLADPGSITTLELSVDYDDAFVAYLNGVEVARRLLAGAAGTPVAFDAFATANREAGTAEAIDISAFIGELRPGSNLLAVQGANRTLDSSDFSLIPELGTGPVPSGGIGCGRILYATANSVGLSGQSNACLTRAVRVQGQPAEYDPLQARWTATVPVAAGDNLVTVQSFDATGALLDATELLVRRIPGPLQTVGGTLGASTVWTAAGGPYRMTSNVVVPAGGTLTIQPGAVIIGEAGASIIVRGRIDALGTEAAPIIFRAAGCDNRWGGIAIDGTGTSAASPTSVLRYCDFEFGDTPGGFSGCVAPVGSKVLIDRCTFRSLTANAIDGTDARVEVRDSLFERIHEGVHCTRSDVIILDCVFLDLVGDKDAIDFDLNGTGRNRIERCLVVNSSDDGIDLQATTVDIRDNIFINVQDKALSLEENGPLGPPVVTGNLIVNCGSAISLKNGVTIREGHHNTLVGNQEGINLFAKAGASNGGHGVFHSMIIWNNIFDVKADALSTISITHSNISAGIFPGAGNISQNPLFADVLGKDFSLRAGSPCIGTGLNGSDMGAIPFTGPPVAFIRGDADEDAALAVGDAIVVLEYLFLRRPGPDCRDRMDSNDDGSLDIADPVTVLLHLFGGKPPPPPPYPEPGFDPTPDPLPCQ